LITTKRAKEGTRTFNVNFTSSLQQLPRKVPVMNAEQYMQAAIMGAQNAWVVKNGGDRQELHEKIREHSMEAGKQVKVEGKSNDLIDRILKDDYFNIDKKRLLEIMDPKNFIGAAAIQTQEFVSEEVDPIIDANKSLLGMEASLKV